MLGGQAPSAGPRGSALPAPSSKRQRDLFPLPVNLPSPAVSDRLNLLSSACRRRVERRLHEEASVQ
eukprot:9389136-Heterocapsa_arctica.AAC.1